MKKVIIVFIFAFYAITACAQNERTFYLWNTTSFIFSANQKTSFGLSTKSHYLASKGIREMTQLDGSAYREVNSWLRAGLGFRFAQQPKEEGDLYEYRPQFITTVHNNGKSKLKIRTTNRLERRFFNSGENHFRYYHNLFFDFRFFSKIPAPYLGEELFNKLNREGLHLTRFYSGFHVYDKKKIVADLYYVFQRSKNSEHWSCSDVAGLNLTFKIGSKENRSFIDSR